MSALGATRSQAVWVRKKSAAYHSDLRSLRVRKGFGNEVITAFSKHHPQSPNFAQPAHTAAAGGMWKPWLFAVACAFQPVPYMTKGPQPGDRIQVSDCSTHLFPEEPNYKTRPLAASQGAKQPCLEIAWQIHPNEKAFLSCSPFAERKVENFSALNTHPQKSLVLPCPPLLV